LPPGFFAGRCDDDAVLRSVNLGIALSVLAAACALVEPPPPPGTRVINAEVHNLMARPAGLTVRPAAGMIPGAAIPGAVQPPLLPGRSTTNVTFYVPMAGRWWIFLQNSNVVISGENIDELVDVDPGCTLFLEFSADESVTLACPGPPG
jgi:hypothetical protein